MYLPRKSNNNQQKIIVYLRSTLLIGSVLAALLSFYSTRMGFLASMLVGFFYVIGVILLPTRRAQLLAILILAILSGLIPSAILLTICNFSKTTTSCQVNSLRAVTFGFFVFPTILMILAWLFSIFFPPKQK